VNRKVLVSGAAGFIGSHLADRLLEDGDQVIIIDNESTGYRENVPPEAIYIKGDVRNPDDVEEAFSHQPDVVLHVAGQASTIRSFNDPHEDLSVNLTGTVNMVRAALRHKVGRFLYAGSMTAYGNPSELPIPETMSCVPISYYGISKYAAERFVQTTGERTDLELPFWATTFRMFNVYGTRQSLDNPYQGVVTVFVSNILRGEPITIYGDGEQSRDFVHVSDVVEAWVRSIDSEVSFGEVYNLGTSTRLTINRLVDVLLESFGQARDTYPVLYEPARPGDQRHMVASVDKARVQLGWKPKVRFEEGIVETLEWAKEAFRPEPERAAVSDS